MENIHLEVLQKQELLLLKKIPMKTEKTVWDLQGHCPEKTTHGSSFDDSRSGISGQTIPESGSVAAGAIMP